MSVETPPPSEGEKSKAGIPRRSLLKALAALGATAAVGGIAYEAFKSRSEEFRAKLEDKDKYPPKEWGEGKITWKDIQNIDVEELRKLISNPAEAVEWLKLVDSYAAIQSQVREEFALIRLEKTQANRDVPDFLDSLQEVMQNYLRGVLPVWHNIFEDHARTTLLLEKYGISSEELESMYNLLSAEGYADQLPLIDHFRGSKSYGIYARAILESALSSSEKAELLLRQPKDRPYVPYTSAFPEGYDPDTALSEDEREQKVVKKDELAELTERIESLSRAPTPVCEDMLGSIMDLLNDDGYPALALVMHREGAWEKMNPLAIRQSGHVVYLVKGKNGYGYIGYNPSLHYSEPKFTTVRELMEKEFSQFNRCIVVDYTDHDLLKQLEESKDQFYFGRGSLVNEAINVEEYPN